MTAAAPALDALAAEGRKFLAATWDESDTHDHERAAMAAWQAATHVTRHPWQAGEPTCDDPQARVELVLEAFRELGELRRADGADALLAGLTFGQAWAEAGLLGADARDAVADVAGLEQFMAGVRRAVAEFIVGRQHGLGRDARALERGMREGDRP